METVSFIHMEEGTREDYLLLERVEKEYAAGLADRVLQHLLQLREVRTPLQIDELQHCLQAASRAYRDKASEEMIVAALLHDLGEDLAPYDHAEVAAAVLRPYVSDATHWIIKHHGIFQTYYYAHHVGGDRNARARYVDHPYYQMTVDFCHKWDQTSFDPNYDTMPLEAFEPMVRRIFSREPVQHAQSP